MSGRPVDRRIFGVDFSGAESAGRAIWLAAGRIEPGGLLRIEDCQPAACLPGSGVARGDCLPALVRFIARQRNAVFGLDFPFSLPASLAGQASWEDFALALTVRYPTAELFRRACRAAAGGRELKRDTDRASRVPFGAYNLRLYRQTYFGIGHLLAPLLRRRAACVLPIQPPIDGKPWLFEICPASTLKASGLYTSYKGRGPSYRAARRRILDELVARGAVAPPAPAVEDRILADSGGDALDSVIAAVAARQAAERPRPEHRPTPLERIEGRVYFAALPAADTPSVPCAHTPDGRALP